MIEKIRPVTFLILGSLLALAGCSAPAANTKVGVPTACVFPDSPKTEAPEWVCDTPVKGVSISAVGIAQPSAAGPGFMKEIAAANGRSELARQLKVHVENMIKRYVESTGAASSETVDALNTVIDKQVTDQYVSNSRLFRSTTSPGGTLYVLVGLDQKMASDASRKVLTTSYKNNEALWQEFKAKKGFDELTNEIDKH